MSGQQPPESRRRVVRAGDSTDRHWVPGVDWTPWSRTAGTALTHPEATVCSVPRASCALSHLPSCDSQRPSQLVGRSDKNGVHLSPEGCGTPSQPGVWGMHKGHQDLVEKQTKQAGGNHRPWLLRGPKAQLQPDPECQGLPNSQ